MRASIINNESKKRFEMNRKPDPEEVSQFFFRCQMIAQKKEPHFY